MADPEEFYEEAVESLVSVGNKALASQFRVEIDDCPHLSKLIITCTPSLPGRWPIEDIPGQQGITINEPGPKKTGGQFVLTFMDSVAGVALKELKNWEKNCYDFKQRKTVRIYQTSEIGDGELDITYTYTWPDIEEGDLDAENRTPARFNINLHFAHKKWTK